ncbi:MAG: dTDP-4-dehydrorhamnose reductase [Acidimicrobiales bacterium]
MRVLVTGAAGQVGAELMRAAWPAGVAVTGVDRRGLDITDAAAVDAVVADLAPEVIVNAAAYTAVDRAETEPDLAQAVNATGVAHLAAAANRHGSRLIHISTDYVFDGTKDGWYVETDPVAPLGVYGATKLAGEQAAAAAERHLILRTAWVYGALGANFVATMLRLGAERDELAVVADQRGCPTAAIDIAAAIVDLVTAGLDGDELTGTYHLASPEEATWHGFACAILAEPIASGRLRVRAIPTTDYPTPAARPANSRLDSTAIADAAGIVLPAWSTTMPAVRAELLERAERTSS